MAGQNTSRGYIIPIGGAENKDKNPTILKKFVDICGPDQARIAIIPTASLLSETGREYQKVFYSLGASKTTVLDIKRRSDCDTSANLELLTAVDGVFITGGDQLRLATILGGTKLAAELLQANQNGVHIAGTSAGAAFISEHMIAGGKSGNAPRNDMVKLATGLGLTDQLIIDQHFRQRHRLGRLITAITYNHSAIGLGVDEDTAAFIDGTGNLEVAGTGWVTIVDPTMMEVSTIFSIKKRQRLSVSDLKIHLLTDGDKYDIQTRKAEIC